MNLDLTIALQRVIELLAFYLILSDMDDNDLKESLTRLVVTKQRNLYGNVVLLIMYPLAMTFFISYVITIPSNGYLIDTILRPFVAYFLLRRVFDIRKALVAHTLSFVIMLPVSALNLLIPLNVTVSFIVILIFIASMLSQNYFKLIYLYLSKQEWLLNIACFISLMIYAILLLAGFSVTMAIILLVLFLLSSLYLHNRNRLKTSEIIHRIDQATSDNLFSVLTKLSHDHLESEVILQYTIENNNSNKIVPVLSNKLEIHKESGTIRNYECLANRWQIKINVIL